MKHRQLIDQKLNVLDLHWDRRCATVPEIQGAVGEREALPTVRAVIPGLEEEHYERPEARGGHRPLQSDGEPGRGRAARQVLAGFTDESVTPPLTP